MYSGSMDENPKTLPLPSVDFSNNFSGEPITPPASTVNQDQPIFSIGVEPPPTKEDNKGSSGPAVTNLQDVGGAHLTVEKKPDMNRSASSPILSQFFSLVPGSKAIRNVNIEVNMPSYKTGKHIVQEDGSSVDPEVKLPRVGSVGVLTTQESQAKHIRKEMQTLYSRGEVNKYGSLFRKPGTDHKVPSSAKSTDVATPLVSQLTPFKEGEETPTPNVSLGQRFKKWITTSPVKHTDREKNAFSPTSF